MFIPEYIRKTGDIPKPPRRLLLTGLVGSGKTFQSLTTSDNPLVLCVSQGISDPRLITLNIPTIPFYDIQFMDKQLKSTVVCNAVKRFISENITKFTPDQTLILDDLTFLQDSVHAFMWVQTKNETPAGKEPDGYAYYDKIRDYWIEFFGLLDKLQCNLIVNAHLQEIRDKNGLFIRYHPFIEGGYKMRIGQIFTDIVMIVTENEKLQGDKVRTKYKWQVSKTDAFPIAKSRLDVDTMYVEASFRNLCKMGTLTTI